MSPFKIHSFLLLKIEAEDLLSLLGQMIQYQFMTTDLILIAKCGSDNCLKV